MHSKELADFTGVTIRALRHYHALGILPEPARSDNGYRSYSVEDAVTVLRIKRLSALGFSLTKIKEMLGSERGSLELNAEALEDLESSLTHEMERLERQRDMVRALLESEADPDVPMTYGAHFANLRKHGAGERLLKLEKAEALLLEEGLTFSPEQSEMAKAVFGVMSDSGAYDGYIALNEDFLALPAEAPAAQRIEMAERFRAWVVTLIAAAGAAGIWDDGAEDEPLEPALIRLVGAYNAEILNDAQIDVSKRLLALLAAENQGSAGMIDLLKSTLDPDAAS